MALNVTKIGATYIIWLVEYTFRQVENSATVIWLLQSALDVVGIDQEFNHLFRYMRLFLLFIISVVLSLHVAVCLTV